jgi:acyl-CoA dehydrogenase
LRSTIIRYCSRRDGADWIFNGSKIFIAYGWHCDLVIVVAKTDPELGATRTSLFIVDTSMPGFIKGRKLHKAGMHAQDTANLFFDNVRVPAAHLLGEPNRGFVYLMQELPGSIHWRNTTPRCSRA